jgi:hypothetical protein
VAVAVVAVVVAILVVTELISKLIDFIKFLSPPDSIAPKTSESRSPNNTARLQVLSIPSLPRLSVFGLLLRVKYQTAAI